MREKKTEFRYFTISEWKQEEQYLRERHNQGWRLTHVTGICLYHFERCAPEDVVYQLDYNPDGMSHKDEYVRMFMDCGWEYLCDYVGYSYFRKPVSQMQSGDEEIFCDEQSRLDMLRRVFRGRMVPLIVIFLCCICTQLVVQRTNDLIFCCFAALFVVYLAIFIKFAVCYWKLKK